MLIHDCDLRLGLHAKRVFDAVGHYSRDDVLGALARPLPLESDGHRAAAPDPGAREPG